MAAFRVSFVRQASFRLAMDSAKTALLARYRLNPVHTSVTFALVVLLLWRIIPTVEIVRLERTQARERHANLALLAQSHQTTVPVSVLNAALAPKRTACSHCVSSVKRERSLLAMASAKRALPARSVHRTERTSATSVPAALFPQQLVPTEGLQFVRRVEAALSLLERGRLHARYAHLVL